MSIAELKEEAIRQFAVKVEGMDDEAELKVMLEFLNGIKGGDQQHINLSRHYSAIKEKYSSVLQRLAK